MPSVPHADDERELIRQLVRELGNARGRRVPNAEEVTRLRDFFGQRALPHGVDDHLLGKYRRHVERDLQWPGDTTPEDFLESLRETVLDWSSAIYLTDTGEGGEWTVYFVGRVRRAWRGPDGSQRIVVLFNGERHFLITGFQPSGDDAYVERQGGFWLHRP